MQKEKKNVKRRIKIAQEGDLKNIIIRPSDLPIIFGLMITIDCISSFCGLVQDADPIYGHAVT